jgi:hypothetical protein|tara:strand:+ start:3922 stop:4560 length:639 start_codon:yes stop_codon:yes gene_type:complete
MALVKYNDRSLRNLTTVPAAVTGNNPGALVHIKTLTASSSGTLSFVNGASSVVLDNTYPIYKFEFINIHPGTNGARLAFQVDTGTNTSYNITVTSSKFKAYQQEDDDNALSYDGSYDQAQGTAFQNLGTDLINDNDSSASGELWLFSPSSSTFVKHFLATVQGMTNGSPPYSEVRYSAGYFNTTTALTRVQFKMDSGNIDAGTFKMYGIKDS